MLNGHVRRTSPTVIALAIVVLVGFVQDAHGYDPNYEKIKAQADIVEKRGEQIPLDLEFLDSTGKPTRLSEYFNGERPVLLMLGYYDCPMLCSLVLDGLVAGLRKLKWSAGQDFTILTVSIDPTENPASSAKWKSKYMFNYSRPGTVNGWHFLTASEETTRALAESVGFGYVWVESDAPAGGEYAHKGAVIVCTPSGEVSQYLHGVAFEPTTLKFSLLQSGEGKIGSFLDQVQMFCYRWDSAEGKYTPVVMNIVRLGGLVTVVGIVLMILLLRRSGSKKSQNPESDEADADNGLLGAKP